MRILDKDNIKVGVRQLGLSEDNFAQFQQLIRRPNGIILVTGPTGSGKTTTLYAALNALNRPDKKIITAEDPVEYYLPGINQVEVRHSIGLDFARIIRAMLRQAPNIILVGEMRDDETASMGIQASLTGHLVFSTLHTNDAPSAVTRMVDMGVPNYLVASSVIAVLAQRKRPARRWHLPEIGSQSNLHERQGLRQLQQERLSRAPRNFRANAH
jgi:type IV pilus assembly protein PilB